MIQIMFQQRESLSNAKISQFLLREIFVVGCNLIKLYLCHYSMNNMKKILLFVFLVFCGSAIKAQTAADAIKIDSLYNVLETADSSSIPQTTINLAKIYASFAPDESIKILRNLLQANNRYFTQNEQLKAYLMLAQIFVNQENIDSANNELLNALAIQENIPFAEDVVVLEPFAEKKSESLWNNLFSPLNILIVVLLLCCLITVIYFLKIKNQNKKKQEALEAKIQSLQSELQTIEQNVEKDIAESTSDLNEKMEERHLKDLELKKTLKKVEDANYLKNAFLTNMSHEIRTPLNGIIGFSNLLETELSLMENAELYEYAKGIQESGDRLLSLLNNIIDISRIDANDIEVEFCSCQVNESLQRVIDLCVFAANEKGLSFKAKLNDIPPVISDSNNLMRVFHIVIDNAIKYTKNGFVTITSTYDETSNNVTVRVKDTGIGMEKEFQTHLFEAFRQESLGYGRSFQGAGLGLPLAKRLIDLMHAKINITSEHDVGTTVEIIIPCENKSATPGETPQKKTFKMNIPVIGELDIFIVEDDRMNRMVLEKMLDKMGKTTLAVDGDQTMKIIDENYNNGHLFQVMLFDINLPLPWDGIKLLHKIKEDYKEYKNIPFIAQTAYAMSGDKERLLEAGFDDYISKPINRNELMTIIQNQITKFNNLTNKQP